MFDLDKFVEDLQENDFDEFKVRRHIVKNDDTVEFTVVATREPSVRKESEESKKRKAYEAIRTILSMHKRPISQRQLAEETGVSRRRLKNRLEELAEEGIVNIRREGVILLKEEE